MGNRPIIMLDISSISYIKDAEHIKSGNDPRKKRRLNELEQYTNGNYRFSLLLSILEKATDYKNEMNKNQLQDRFEKDYDQIISFLGKENIKEPIDMLIACLMDGRYSKEDRAELSIPNRLQLLNFYNDKGIVNTPPKTDRFKLAKEVINKAVSLELSTGEPTVLVCVSAIFGCTEARDILKIKENKDAFNASNALGDIMSLTRVAKVRSLLIKPGIDIIYRTEDEALEVFHKYIEVITNGDHVSCHLLKPQNLFPVFYKGDNCVEPSLQSELYELLGYTVR